MTCLIRPEPLPSTHDDVSRFARVRAPDFADATGIAASPTAHATAAQIPTIRRPNPMCSLLVVCSGAEPIASGGLGVTFALSPAPSTEACLPVAGVGS